jgi:hypothetical protein
MSDDPPRRVAETLAEARPGSMIYVDERGQVRSLASYRRQVAKSLAYVGVTAVLSGLLYAGAGGGPFGLVCGGVVALLLTRFLPAWRRLDRAARLMTAERFDEAEPLLRRTAASRFTDRTFRARAEALLAMLVALRGDHAQAFALRESALARRGVRRGDRRALEYAQVVALINLDRAPEAAARFAALPRQLEGDYLRVQRAYAELYLAFIEDRRSFDRDELKAQIEHAMSMPYARVWLTLLAWAHDQIGARGEADRLLAEAATRPSEARVRALYPKVADWLARR